MSASLVGSEMCIRDRSPPARPPRPRPRSRAACPRAGHRAGGSQAARAPGCLLYTSDAADDM
eukprot:8173828-Alexandrium_andersonii.AAC.1